MRCVQIGLTMADLDLLDIGMVLDMFVEKANDDYYSEQEHEKNKNPEVREATAEDVAAW